MDRQSRFANGIGSTVRRTNGRGVPRLRISALRYPLLEGRRVRNRQFGRKPAGMCRAATLPLGLMLNGENNDADLLAKRTRECILAERTRGPRSDARLLRF